jgi:hypothetical protein
VQWRMKPLQKWAAAFSYFDEASEIRKARQR